MEQLRITNEIGAVVTAILAGCSALFFAAWMISSEPEDLILQTSNTSSRAKLAELESSNTNLSKQLADEQSRHTRLSSQLEQARSENLKFEKSLVGSTENSARLQKKNAALEAESESLRASLEKTALQLAELKKQQREEESAPSPKEQEAREAELAASRKKEEELSEALTECREKSDSLQKELKSLRRKHDETVYGEQLKPASEFPPLDLPLLVNNPIDLGAPARPLFIRLREFTGEPDKLDALYAALKEEGIHSTRHQVPFGAGSDEASDEEKQKISELLKSTSPESRFLVVGYASTDGSEKDNYELSSRRASHVAQWVGSQSKIPADAIQAVYFGQTNRFSASEMAPNRVVEIWEIK